MALDVDARCGKIDDQLDSWQTISDVMKGEKAIKNGGQKYCPKLSGQSTTEYGKYIDRGSFFNAFTRTTMGLSGAAMRKGVREVKVPSDLNEYVDSMDGYGMSLEEMARTVMDEIVSYGYYAIVVDATTSDDGRSIVPYAAMYESEDIVNVRFGLDANGNKEIALLVLREESIEPDPENWFGEVVVELRRVWAKDDDNNVYVEIWKRDAKGEWAITQWNDEGDERFYPKVLGNYLEEIPCVLFGSRKNNDFPEKPPLMDLVNLNIAHWRLTVDLRHGLHFTALPTPWVSGVQEKQKPLYIGSMKAWVLPSPEAKAGYLEFTGKGLEAISKEIESVEKKMAVMGARLLEETKKQAEAAETIRLRSSGDTAILTNMVLNTEKGLEEVLGYFLMWLNKAGKEISIELNKDFVSTRLDHQDLLALVKALVVGGISQETFLYNLQQGEILPDDISIEDEKNRLEIEDDKDFREVDNEAKDMRRNVKEL